MMVLTTKKKKKERKTKKKKTFEEEARNVQGKCAISERAPHDCVLTSRPRQPLPEAKAGPRSAEPSISEIPA